MPHVLTDTSTHEKGNACTQNTATNEGQLFPATSIFYTECWCTEDSVKQKQIESTGAQLCGTYFNARFFCSVTSVVRHWIYWYMSSQKMSRQKPIGTGTTCGIHKLKAAETDQCICQNGFQSPEHILKSCSLIFGLRTQTWPRGLTAEEKTKMTFLKMLATKLSGGWPWGLNVRLKYQEPAFDPR